MRLPFEEILIVFYTDIHLALYSLLIQLSVQSYSK